MNREESIHALQKTMTKICQYCDEELGVLLIFEIGDDRQMSYMSNYDEDDLKNVIAEALMLVGDIDTCQDANERLH